MAQSRQRFTTVLALNYAFRHKAPFLDGDITVLTLKLEHICYQTSIPQIITNRAFPNYENKKLMSSKRSEMIFNL